MSIMKKWSSVTGYDLNKNESTDQFTSPSNPNVQTTSISSQNICGRIGSIWSGFLAYAVFLNW